nr:uncharacterized protein LOC118972772 [Manis javanica]
MCKEQESLLSLSRACVAAPPAVPSGPRGGAATYCGSLGGEAGLLSERPAAPSAVPGESPRLRTCLGARAWRTGLGLEHGPGPGTRAWSRTPSRSFRKGLVPGSPGLGAAARPPDRVLWNSPTTCQKMPVKSCNSMELRGALGNTHNGQYLRQRPNRFLPSQQQQQISRSYSAAMLAVLLGENSRVGWEEEATTKDSAPGLGSSFTPPSLVGKRRQDSHERGPLNSAQTLTGVPQTGEDSKEDKNPSTT